MSNQQNGGYTYGYPYSQQFGTNQGKSYPGGYGGQWTGQQMPFFPGFQQQASFPTMPSGGFVQTPGSGQTGVEVPGMLPSEQSYIENIFRLNKGKLVTVYMTFEGSTEWNSKVFRGVVEAAGRDHLILSDPETGYRYLLPMVYFNYAVFEEEIDYFYPFGGQMQGAATYQPR